jgi:glycerate kinase
LGAADAGWLAAELPVADGGDGTLVVLLAAHRGTARVDMVRVHGPTGRMRGARLGWLGPAVAVVEMAEAVGIRLLRGRSDPMGSSSRGAGELIAAALERGAERVIVGVGGSASTDGGTGILAALGARVLDRAGRPVPPGGGSLHRVARVDLDGLDQRLARCRVEVAVDVWSPLFGPTGAASVFAPQKGADAAQVAQLDDGLRGFAEVLERASGRSGLATEPGSGAAGGAAFGLAAVGAVLMGGAALVCDEVGLDAALAGASLVLTGEGRLDSQTRAGKAPAEVADRARRAGIPCIAVCGSVDGGTELFTDTIALDRLGPDPRRHARSLLRRAGVQAARAF